MVKWVRSGVMEGAPELVGELGGDYRALAREAGVPETPMANPDLPMRVDRFVAFMELAATRLGEPAFGLRLGPYQSLSLFGPMAPLLGSAANVRSMIMDIANFFPLHTQGTIVGVEPADGGLLLTYELSTEVGSQQRQVVELGFSVIAREMRRHDPMWKPDLVTMRHSPPEDLSWHYRMLGDRIMFNGDRNALLIDQDLLARPVAGADPAVHGLLAAQYGTAARSVEGLDVLQAEALIRAMLPFAPIDLSIAARLLRKSRRTLQRQLAAHGTSFADLFVRVRASLALLYLRESSLNVAEIAEILQFSQTSALSRFMTRTSGECPRQIRKQRHAV
ncbi:AraC family transcriptional regulator [Aquisediminimonas profunda]|uniref:AraC family transcriptional regulator n=1 Tax=Aquisediminimonas profunda TaxID=1550733 RepID=UPI001C63A843|nr:AraC family transcriptional regulator [Aquisediminimonas profunda]